MVSFGMLLILKGLGSSSQDPQSNSRAESTIRLKVAWKRRLVDQNILALPNPSYSTETCHAGEMICYQHRSFVDTWSKIHSRHTEGSLLLSGNVLLTLSMPKRFCRKLSPSMTNMLTHFWNWHLVLMLLSRTLHLKHGISMASSQQLSHTIGTSFVPSQSEC